MRHWKGCLNIRYMSQSSVRSACTLKSCHPPEGSIFSRERERHRRWLTGFQKLPLDWPISLCMAPSRSIHTVTNAKMPFLRPSNTSVGERQIPYDFTYLWNLKNNEGEQTKQEWTHRHREQTDSCQRGGKLGDWAKGWRDWEVQIGSYKMVMGTESTA